MDNIESIKKHIEETENMITKFNKLIREDYISSDTTDCIETVFRAGWETISGRWVFNENRLTTFDEKFNFDERYTSNILWGKKYSYFRIGVRDKWMICDNKKRVSMRIESKIIIDEYSKESQ